MPDACKRHVSQCPPEKHRTECDADGAAPAWLQLLLGGSECDEIEQLLDLFV